VTLEAGRPYFSIGEVLNVLKDSFPDVTVSKIRFLESEGLIQPERTQSGYRKFTESDIERLRFILRLQREHFLPLKVIRERLDEVDASGSGAGQSRLALDQIEAAAEAPKTVADMSGGGVSMSGLELANASGLTDDQIDLDQMEPVGLFGVRPYWKDGHNTGIYGLSLLRAICPCDECAAARAAR